MIRGDAAIAWWFAIGAVGTVLGLALALAGCNAKSPRDVERASVILAAEALRQVDIVCATRGAETKDVKLLTTCRDAYDIARPALVLAQTYLDTGSGDWSVEFCAGAKALGTEVDAIAQAGATVPPIVSDALHFAANICGS